MCLPAAWELFLGWFPLVYGWFPLVYGWFSLVYVHEVYGDFYY